MVNLRTQLIERVYGALILSMNEDHHNSFTYCYYDVALTYGVHLQMDGEVKVLHIDSDDIPYDFCVFKEQLLAFSNPHVVTISGTAHSLKRISESAGVAVFQKIAASLEITLTLRHTRESKKADGSQIIRHNIELVMTTWDVNLKPEVTQVYAVSRSRVGADPAVVTAVLDALGVQVDAQSASLVDSDVGP
jgi:HPt (histidine-containing phosphotransfer) domain-containing protein